MLAGYVKPADQLAVGMVDITAVLDDLKKCKFSFDDSLGCKLGIVTFGTGAQLLSNEYFPAPIKSRPRKARPVSIA